MARFPVCAPCGGEDEVTMRTPEAVKIQLVCSMRPLTAGMPGGHLALKTREGMFNLAPAVAIGGRPGVRSLLTLRASSDAQRLTV
jgi:hypothetical protein